MSGEILITGAGGFLGSKFAKFYSENGFRVIGIDKNIKKLALIENEDVITICADITKEAEVKKIYNFLRKKYTIIGLINNAAIDAVPKKNFLKKPKIPKY